MCFILGLTHAAERRNTGDMTELKHEQDKFREQFVLLTAGVFLFLWLLEAVFMPVLYRMSAERTVRRAADKIAAHSRKEDLFEEIDRLSTENALLIFVTEHDGTILYSSDSYKPFYRSYGSGDGGTSNPYIYHFGNSTTPDRPDQTWLNCLNLFVAGYTV